MVRVAQGGLDGGRGEIGDEEVSPMSSHHVEEVGWLRWWGLAMMSYVVWVVRKWLLECWVERERETMGWVAWILCERKKERKTERLRGGGWWLREKEKGEKRRELGLGFN